MIVYNDELFTKQDRSTETARMRFLRAIAGCRKTECVGNEAPRE
jgi:hypothetical protein